MKGWKEKGKGVVIGILVLTIGIILGLNALNITNR